MPTLDHLLKPLFVLLFRTKDVLPELVGGGLANIPSLNIHELNKQFVPLQIIDFFERLGQDSRVESLTLQTADLAYIEKTVLARALTSVRRLTLGLVTLTSEQVPTASCFLPHLLYHFS